MANEELIGKLVTFKIPCVGGQKKVAGIVKRHIYGGIVEVKTQQDGYYNVDPQLFITVTDSRTA